MNVKTKQRCLNLPLSQIFWLKYDCGIPNAGTSTTTNAQQQQLKLRTETSYHWSTEKRKWAGKTASPTEIPAARYCFIHQYICCEWREHHHSPVQSSSLLVYHQPPIISAYFVPIFIYSPTSHISRLNERLRGHYLSMLLIKRVDWITRNLFLFIISSALIAEVWFFV